MKHFKRVVKLADSNIKNITDLSTLQNEVTVEVRYLNMIMSHSPCPGLRYW